MTLSVRVEMAGRTFDRWTVLEESGRSTDGAVTWLCRCECGSERVVNGVSLRRGVSRSCGCLRNEVTKQRNALRVGEANPMFGKPGRSGSRNHMWRGDEVTYNGMHTRVRKSRGPASQLVCVDTGSPASDWSWRGWCEEERTCAIEGLRFCTHPDHYEPRTRAAHIAFDSTNRGVAE